MAQPAPSDVTVVIPTCDDDLAVLRRTFEAVTAEGLPRQALVSDMSRGAGVRALAEEFDGIRHIPFPEAHGLSESRNLLVAEADTRFVLFLDADAVPQPGWAPAMRRAFERLDGTAVVGARCVAEWPGRVPALFDTAPAGDFLSLFELGDRPLEVETIMGTSYALDRTRMPDPPFRSDRGYTRGARMAGEEVALCLAVREAGWKVVYEPDAVVRHCISPERARWGFMYRRVFRAGREASRLARESEPVPRLPRSLTVRDRLFLAAVAPSYFAGRLRGA